MDDNIVYLTEEKKKELELELEDLQTTKRKEILDTIEYAKSLGDLSENAEYQQGREAQARLEERIRQIENILKSAVVVEKHHSTKVEIGSVIQVQKEGNKEEKTYEIVGSEEADTKSGKISNESPLGQALLGKKKGEIAAFESPMGTIKYKIVDIE